MIKKILSIIIILILLFEINVYAVPNTKDRTQLPNYGVNKNIEITNYNKNKILNTYAVDASEKIYDFSDILTEAEEKQLKKKIDMFIKKYKTDLVIIVDNLEYSDDYENENFSRNFYNYNDFGIEYNNSGILLFRNTYSKDLYYNIYSFGENQLYVSSERKNATLDNIYDYLREKKYLNCFSKFIDDITMYYEHGIPKEMQKYEIDEMGTLTRKYDVPWIIVIGLSFVITFIVMYILVNKNKMVSHAKKANQYINKEKSNLTNKRDVFLSTSTRTYIIDSNESNSNIGGRHR